MGKSTISMAMFNSELLVYQEGIQCQSPINMAILWGINSVAMLGETTAAPRGGSRRLRLEEDVSMSGRTAELLNFLILGTRPGKLLHSYGKPLFLMGKSTISMAMFKFANCHSLPGRVGCKVTSQGPTSINLDEKKIRTVIFRPGKCW